MSQTILINRKNVRLFSLSMAKNTRSHQFTRVGSEFFVRCDTQLKEFIRQYIQNLQSKSKTIL